MRVLLQRVNHASVVVGGAVAGEIGQGLLLFVGIAEGDAEADAALLAGKVLDLRVFPDREGRFDLSVRDVQGGLLAVSQFTLYADTRRGRRPSFAQAARPEEARALFQRFVRLLGASGLHVATGRFQEHMLVSLENDGPVTILLDSADRRRPRSEG
jgi:D-tyrosyl-tRNA(Tyr) deacylase